MADGVSIPATSRINVQANLEVGSEFVTVTLKVPRSGITSSEQEIIKNAVADVVAKVVEKLLLSPS